MKRALIAGGLLLGLALLASPAQAQTGTARGKVVDADGKPIAEAKVLIEFSGGITRKFEVKTNKKGEYMQVGLQPGPYHFTVSKEGHQPVSLDFRVNLGDPTTLPDFKLLTAAAAAQQAGSPQAELRESFQKAIDLAAAGQLDEAEAAYNAILAKTPDVPEVYHNLGQVYSKKKDWAKAEAAYRKAIELRPEFVQPYLALSNMYLTMGEKAKASEVLAQAPKEGAAGATIICSSGLTYINNGETEKAQEAFEKCVAADPTGFPDAYFFLASGAMNRNDIPKAIEMLEKFLSLNPTKSEHLATAQALLAALKKK
jgi:tetratricopeptide (TPR) repeat protein